MIPDSNSLQLKEQEKDKDKDKNKEKDKDVKKGGILNIFKNMLFGK